MAPGLPLAVGDRRRRHKIGDIDTGIDETHPFFDPMGSHIPTDFPKCDAADSASHHEDQDCNYVSEKVIVAKVF